MTRAVVLALSSIALAACGSAANASAPVAVEVAAHERLVCSLRGQGNLDGNVLYLDADLRVPIALFAAARPVAIELKEVRYRRGYYEHFRIVVRAPPSGPGVTMDGWVQSTALWGVALRAMEGPDCFARAKDIDPRHKRTSCCASDCIRDAFDLPSVASKPRLRAPSGLSMFGSPEVDALRIGLVDRGAELAVLEVRPGWWRVAMPEGELVAPRSEESSTADAIDFWIPNAP